MIKNILEKLCLTDGVSGNEHNISLQAFNILKAYTQKVSIDNNFNVCAVMGNLQSDYHIMLDAHIDQIGFIITDILKDGKIKFKPVGGIDNRIILGKKVNIFPKNIQGIIASDKPVKEVIPIDSMYIDPIISEDEAKNNIKHGDIAVFDNSVTYLLNDRVSSASLDNRCGVACLIYLAKLLTDHKVDVKVSIVLSSQEETGEFGAKVKSFELQPDEAIVVDVSFAQQYKTNDKGFSQLNLGPMIGIAPILDKPSALLFEKIAKEKNIPVQYEVMSSTTGTNSDVISCSRCGVKTSLLSIPLRYMHTNLEVISLSDIKNTALLILDYLVGLKGDKNA